MYVSVAVCVCFITAGPITKLCACLKMNFGETYKYIRPARNRVPCCRNLRPRLQKMLKEHLFKSEESHLSLFPICRIRRLVRVAAVRWWLGASRYRIRVHGGRVHTHCRTRGEPAACATPRTPLTVVLQLFLKGQRPGVRAKAEEGSVQRGKG